MTKPLFLKTILTDIVIPTFLTGMITIEVTLFLATIAVHSLLLVGKGLLFDCIPTAILELQGLYLFLLFFLLLLPFWQAGNLLFNDLLHYRNNRVILSNVL